MAIGPHTLRLCRAGDRRCSAARVAGLVVTIAVVVAGCTSAAESDPVVPRITGVVLMTAPPTTTTTIPAAYVVQRGDTLMGIAQRFGLDMAKLAAANGIADPDDIEAGQSLTIAGVASTATTTTTP